MEKSFGMGGLRQECCRGEAKAVPWISWLIALRESTFELPKMDQVRVRGCRLLRLEPLVLLGLSRSPWRRLCGCPVSPRELV